jgi:hypothetical protein
MLNAIIYSLVGKNIVFYNKHRQTALFPLTNNAKYLFIDPKFLFKSTFIFGRKSKLRYRVMAAILTLFSPVYIIDINWIARQQTLYLQWCKRNRHSKFIVLQHGTYVGGVITDIPHRYAKCNVLLCWSNYFFNEFMRYNVGKEISIRVWGNPIYNGHNRERLTYKMADPETILIATSVVTGTRKAKLEEFIGRLTAMGFKVLVKEHSFQRKLSTGIDAGEEIHDELYSVLSTQRYDLVVSDVSTSLLDSIFFKNRTLFFSPFGELVAYTENIYADFMTNIANDAVRITCKEDLLYHIDVERQEELLRFLVTPGNNRLDGLES